MNPAKVIPPLAIFVIVAWAAWGQGVPSEAPLGEAPPPVTGVGTWHGLADPAPAWSEGGQVRWDRLAGKVVVLEFATSWCPGCKRAAPTLKALKRKHGKDGLVVVAITTADAKQDAAAIAGWAKGLKAPLGVLASGEALRAYGVNKIPYAVVVGRDGKVAWKGNPDASKKAFKRAVKAAVKAKTLDSPASRPASQPAPR